MYCHKISRTTATCCLLSSLEFICQPWRAGGKVNRGEESCISKTTLRLLNGSFRTRTSTLTACVAVGCGAERQQLQLQLRLGSPGTLLRYGLISREKRNYPESQSVGSVRRIISPWNCGRAVFPSCRLSEQSALFLTLRGGTCERDRRGAQNSRK